MTQVNLQHIEKPKYLQIREAIRDEIEDGFHQPGSAIPSENELAERFNVTRLTVRNAVDALVAGGLLRRVQGKGVYVMNEHLGESDAVKLAGFRESVRARSAVPSVKVLSKTVRPAGEFFAHLFEIDCNADLLAIKVIDGVSHQLGQVDHASSSVGWASRASHGCTTLVSPGVPHGETNGEPPRGYRL